jgi:hypothetical protein
MRNYSEFKGYLTRIGYDRELGAFVYERVIEDESKWNAKPKGDRELSEPGKKELEIGAIRKCDTL